MCFEGITLVIWSYLFAAVLMNALLVNYPSPVLFFSLAKKKKETMLFHPNLNYNNRSNENERIEMRLDWSHGYDWAICALHQFGGEFRERIVHTISGRLRDKVIERLIDVQDNQSEVGKLVLQILRGDIELVIE